MALVSATQMRAARAILAWTQEDFAAASSLSLSTIRNIESGLLSLRSATNAAIHRAIENAGLELLNDDGIKRRDDIVRIYKGETGAPEFFDSLLRDLRKAEGEIAIALTTPETHRWFFSPQNAAALERFNQPAAAMAVKCLLAEAPIAPVVAPMFDVRLTFTQHVARLPCVIARDRYAEIAHTDTSSPPYLVSFRIPHASRIYFEEFRQVWKDGQRVSFPRILRGRKG